MAEIIWKLDESNEITFKVDISSSEPFSGSPKARLVCETSGIDYSFPGRFNKSGEVEIIIPPMEGKLLEGGYKAKLEVIFEDKYFIPLEFDAHFEMATKVMAEIVQKPHISTERERPIKASFVTKTPSVVKSHHPIEKQTQTRLKSLKEKFGK